MKWLKRNRVTVPWAVALCAWAVLTPLDAWLHDLAGAVLGGVCLVASGAGLGWSVGARHARERIEARRRAEAAEQGTERAWEAATRAALAAQDEAEKRAAEARADWISRHAGRGE